MGQQTGFNRVKMINLILANPIKNLLDCFQAEISNFMPAPITVSHPIGRIPTFFELQGLAKENGVQINGNEQIGEFSRPQAKGIYSFEKTGDISGELIVEHTLGVITGIFIIASRKVEVTVKSKPFLMPEGALISKIFEGLKVFCAKFSPLD